SLQRFHDEVPPFLPRVPSRSVPLVPRYYEVLRTPAAPHAALRCLRLALPPVAPAFVSPTRPDAGLGAWSALVWPPRPTGEWRRSGFSGSWETPLCLCPGLRPRQDLPTRP